MKIRLTLFALFFGFTGLMAQDSSQVISQEVTYYKNPTKQTKKRKKAYLEKVKTVYQDSTQKEEMKRLSDGSVRYRRIMKDKQPLGTWIESTSDEVVKINTAQINYCINQEIEESDFMKKLDQLTPVQEKIYMSILQKTNYPDLAMALQIKGTVVIQMELSPQGDISNACILKSVHPILDKEVQSTVNSLGKFENPIDTVQKISLPIAYNLR